MAKTDLYRARESFVTMFEGEQVSVQKGDLVRAGHGILKRREEHFEPAEGYIRFDVEKATKAPGEKRGNDAPAAEKAKAAEKPKADDKK